MGIKTTRITPSHETNRVTDGATVARQQKALPSSDSACPWRCRFSGGAVTADCLESDMHGAATQPLTRLLGHEAPNIAPQVVMALKMSCVHSRRPTFVGGWRHSLFVSLYRSFVSAKNAQAAG